MNDLSSTALFRSNAELQALINAIDRVQGVVELDLDGRVLAANDNFLSWLGYTRDEIAGQPHAILCRPEYAASDDYKAFWQVLRSGDFHAGRFERVSKTGESVWIEASYNPVFDDDGRAKSIVKFASNVTAETLRHADFEAKIEAIDQSQGVVEFALDGTILSANDNFLNAVGYPAQALVGQHHSILCDPAYAASANYAEFWSRLRRGEFSTGEYRRVRRDGAPVWLQATYNPVLDASGRPIKVVKFATDITAVKLRNADSEAKMRALDLSQAVIEFDLSGRVLAANENFLRIFNYTLDQVVGRHHLMFCEEAHVRTPAYAEFWRSLGEGRFRAGQFKRVDSLGRDVWLQASYNPVMDADGRLFKIVKFATDITDQKRRNADFEGVVTAIKRSVAVIEFDLKGRVLDVSPRMASILEYPPEDLIGEHHTRLLDPELFDQEQYTAFWTALRRGEPQHEDVVRLSRSGRRVYLEASYTPVADAEGRIYKVIKFAIDLTERHSLNEALREAVRKAEAATEAKTMFLANMSHEIRTPMNAIIGFTDLLTQERLDPKQSHYVEVISTSARSLLRLLNDILDASKLENASVQLEQIDFSLYSVCEHCIDTMGVLAHRKGISLGLEYPSEMSPYFLGDPERIRQIVVNLMSNAIKFTERGGVTLEVASDAAGQVVITVRDTGIGIPADRLEGIFEPFSQADGSITRRYGGTGLGTTIVRQLVTLMDGRVEVESTVGVGSQFRVTLPLKPGKKPTEQGLRDLDDIPTLRILAVDDSPHNIELLLTVLARGGHQVSTAANGQRAVDLYREQPFDLVLMDVHMPILDGFQATREIRRIENDRRSTRVPIIALTASVEVERRHLAIEAGMDSFVMKPLDIAILKAEITRVTSGKVTPMGLVAAVASTSEAPCQRVEAVDWAGGIARWGGEEVLLRAIRTFLNETQASLASLVKEPIPEPERIKQIMHRIKGAASNLSLLRVTAEAKAAEAAAPTMSAEDYAAALSRIGEEIAAVDQAVEQRQPAAAKASGAAIEIDSEALAELVERVGITLRNFEIDEALLGELESAIGRTGFAGLQTAIDSFDFEAALRALESLKQTATA